MGFFCFIRENSVTSDENDSDAWDVAGDGSIVVNDGYRVRFEGKVSDRNIINNGAIAGESFEDSEIAYEEGTVITDDVELYDTTLINLDDEENLEEDIEETDEESVAQDDEADEFNVIQENNSEEIGEFAEF